MIAPNDKRRKYLKNKFKETFGLDPIMELSPQFISKKPKVYMSKYTHYLENLAINNMMDDTIIDADKIISRGKKK